MKIKVFSTWKQVDLSNVQFLGSEVQPIRLNTRYLVDMTRVINEFLEGQNFKVHDIRYAYVNENIQQGPGEMNIERRINFVATLFYS